MGKLITTATNEWLVVNTLIVDPDYQRTVRKAWVQELQETFATEKLTPFIISRRPDGRELILDGQHRKLALEAMGWGDQRVSCYVHTGLTREKEAEIFADGANNTKRLTVLDRFKARVKAGNSTYLEICKAVEAAGFAVDWSNSKIKNGVTSVSKLSMIFNEGGATAVTNVLRVIADAWGRDEKMAIRAEMLHGMWSFWRFYSTSESFNRIRLIEVLKKIAPEILLRKAAALKQLGGSTLGTGRHNYIIAGIVQQLYNGHVKAGRRLRDITEVMAEERSALASKTLHDYHAKRREREAAKRVGLESDIADNVERAAKPTDYDHER